MKYLILFFASCSFAQEIDPNYYYTLSNSWLGQGKSLGYASDESIILGDTSPAFTGQLWRFEKDYSGAYRISTALRGKRFCLSSVDHRLVLSPTRQTDDQLWSIEFDGDTYFRITTMVSGQPQALDVINDGTNDQVHLVDYGPYSGQFWRADASFFSDSIPTIEPPHFISQNNFFVEEPGRLTCVLPNPNSDGSDPFGINDVLYHMVIQGEDGDQPLYDEDITSDEWPLRVQIDLELADYTISLSRKGRAYRAQESQAITLPGPSTVITDVPLSYRNLNRWLLHLPKLAGGFEGFVELRNPTSQFRSVSLQAFDQNGAQIALKNYSVAGNRVSNLPLYGPGGLFPDPDLLDRVSHLGLVEDGHNVEMALLTKALSTGFGVWTKEVDLQRAQQSGVEVELAGTTPDEGYYMGAAVLNLHAVNNAELSVSRLDSSGNTVLDSISLGNLAPGQKTLIVPSLMFEDFLPNARYVISNDADGGLPIQVFGLTGKLNGDFLGEARVLQIR